MKSDKIEYWFMYDLIALEEIRKFHQEQRDQGGEPMGFATAAFEWVKKYGEERKMAAQENFFAERRRYRRFQINEPVKLVKERSIFLARTINISLNGLLCRSSDLLPVGKEMEALLPLDPENYYRVKVERSLSVAAEEYEVLLKFDERSRMNLQANKNYLAKISS